MDNSFGYSQRKDKNKDKRLGETNIWYRLLYWALVLIALGGIVAGVYFVLEADFGQCNSYDVKCY